MNVANEKQIGGDHYKADLQHWDFVEINGVGYIEGCATKYVARWRKKYKELDKKREDLNKALHYVEKLIELVRSGVRPASRTKPQLKLWQEFIEANDLNQVETLVIKAIFAWENEFDLRHARDGIELLLCGPDAI